MSSCGRAQLCRTAPGANGGWPASPGCRGWGRSTPRNGGRWWLPAGGGFSVHGCPWWASCSCPPYRFRSDAVSHGLRALTRFSRPWPHSPRTSPAAGLQIGVEHHGAGGAGHTGNGLDFVDHVFQPARAWCGSWPESRISPPRCAALPPGAWRAAGERHVAAVDAAVVADGHKRREVQAHAGSTLIEKRRITPLSSIFFTRSCTAAVDRPTSAPTSA